MSSFVKGKVGDLLTLQRGFDITKKQQAEGIFPVVSSSGITSYHNEFMVKGPGVVIGRKGTLGSAFYIKSDYWPHDTTLWVKDFKGSDPKFTYYFLKTLRLERLDSGSSNPTLNRNFVHELDANKPEPNAQQKIAAVLSALDARIDCNNHINAELEAMAKTLYDYWFVQFDFPDANGKPYKYSGGKMIYNATLKREIPAGWETEPLLDSCQVTDCLHSKKSEYFFESEDNYLLQLENILDSGQVDLSKKYFVSKEDYRTWTSRIEIKQHDIVMTNAGRVAAFAQIPANVICGIGRNITAIRPHNIKPNFFFLSLSGLHIQSQILANLDQGAFFKSFNVKGIKVLNILRPHQELESVFEVKVAPIIEKRHALAAENQQLAQLRDWLLPLLMSGQVTVA